MGKLVLTDEGLPLAGGARVARELRVGLKAELAAERRLDLALVATRSGEQRAAELSLDEELRVENLGCRVEWRARDRRVDLIGGRDSVRGQQPNDFLGSEIAGVGKAREDAVDRVERLRDRAVGRGHRRVHAADEDVELRRAGAVAGADGAGELNAAQRERERES